MWHICSAALILVLLESILEEAVGHQLLGGEQEGQHLFTTLTSFVEAARDQSGFCSAMQLWLPPTLKSFLNFLWNATFLVLKHAMAVFDVPETVAMLRAKAIARVDAHRLTSMWHAGMCCRPTPNELTQSV